MCDQQIYKSFTMDGRGGSHDKFDRGGTTVVLRSWCQRNEDIIFI